MIKLMIDSASDITENEAQALGVTLMPIEVRFDNIEYLDGVDINPQQFFELLLKTENLPKTSLINEYRWEEAFTQATSDGSEVIVISLSSLLSGSYNAAKEAAKKFNGKVYVIDSKSATIGERLLLQYAQTLIKKGLSAKEIASILTASVQKLNIKAFIDTLKYLKMGGRISGAVAVVGGMLSIKPIIAVEEGVIKNIGKAMGTKKAIVTLKNIVKEKQIDYDMPFGIVWSGLNDSNLQLFLADAKELWQGKEQDLQIYPMGCTIGTHIGPGAVGFVFFEK